MSENKKLLKFAPITKIDENTHTVYGLCASETPDKDQEIFDFNYGKAALQKWSNDTLARTVGSGADPSLGNIRIMHGLTVGGKVTKLEFKDDEKQVWIETQPVNEEVWQQLKRGMLSAFSVGGSYAWKKKEGDNTRYGSDISEISYVDNPANPDAVFTFVRADGSMELRKFAPRDPNKVIADAAELAKAQAEEFAALAKMNDNHDEKGRFAASAAEANQASEVANRTGKQEDHLHASNLHMRASAEAGAAGDKDAQMKHFMQGTEHHNQWMAAAHKEPGVVRTLEERLKNNPHVDPSFNSKQLKEGQTVSTRSGAKYSNITRDSKSGGRWHGTLVEKPADHYLDLHSNEVTADHPDAILQHDSGVIGRRYGFHQNSVGMIHKKADHDDLGKTRNPGGRFDVQGSGETHDFLVNSGYTHERNGESQQHGIGVKFPIAVYQNGNQSVAVHSNGYWEHNDGHQVRTTGSGLEDLKSHLTACMAVKDEMDKGDGLMSQEQLTNIEGMLKRFHLPVSVEQLERMAKGDRLTVAEEEELEAEREKCSTQKAVKYLVPDGNHLPYTDASGNPDHRLMGAAWAALHGGYRGNKYEGADKEEAISRLKEVYDREGMATPGSKAAKGDGITPEEAKELEDAQLDPEDRIDDANDDNDADDDEDEAEEAEARGNSEQVSPAVPAKTAASQLDKGDTDSMKHVEELVKAAKGLASHFKAAEAMHEEAAKTHEDMAECHKAAHGHHKAEKADELIKGMATHHMEMHKLHKAMAKMHKAFAAHCSKMAGGCEEGAEKTTKAAEVDETELTKSVADLGTVLTTGFETLKSGFGNMIKTEVTSLGLGDLVKTSVADAIKAQPANDGTQHVKAAGLNLISRDGKKIEPQSTEGVAAGDSGL